MSELKRHHINEVMDMHCLTKGELGYSYVYYADDVDKVIAEKDAKIADLIKKNKRLAHKDLIMASETFKEVFKELRYQKFKRCAAMASYWVAVSYQCVDDKHRQRAKKHRYKWLELAKQFKETK